MRNILPLRGRFVTLKVNGFFRERLNCHLNKTRLPDHLRAPTDSGEQISRSELAEGVQFSYCSVHHMSGMLNGGPGI
jgi:hypothetical protein